MKFYFVHIVKVCFVFKNSYYAYIPPYMNKTLPTLGNEKEQQETKFYEKLLGQLIFLRVTKNLKVLFHLPNWASAQKVSLHHCWACNPSRNYKTLYYIVIIKKIRRSAKTINCILLKSSTNFHEKWVLAQPKRRNVIQVIENKRYLNNL